MGGKKKVPRAEVRPAGGKQARAEVGNLGNWDEMPITWHFRYLDHGGPFGWRLCDRDTLVNIILDRARSFETMTWRELRAKDILHRHTMDQVPRETRRRLVEIDQDDIDALHSLRIEKRRRVWGIRDRLYFRVLWWDPDHQVYPMNITDN